MIDKQLEFLQLAVVEKMPYDDIAEKIKIPRSEFAPWWDELKTQREQLAIIRDKWKSKCPEVKFADFKNWFKNAHSHCHYCGITEEQIAQLWSKYPDLTKRNRGRKLEIDRLLPNESYNNISNLVFSCYWCNNAKTDTFTEEEFKQIGEVIKTIWQKRLHDN